MFPTCFRPSRERVTELYRRFPRSAAPFCPRFFRGVVVASALCLLIADVRDLLQADPATSFVLFALIFLSRSVPVAIAREKPITFTAAFVFATALLVNGVAAGWSAFLACVLHARFLRSGGRAHAFFLGAQYALAALAAHAAFVALAGETEVTRSPRLADFVQVCLAALIFVAVNALLVGLGHLGTRYARRRHAEPVLRAQAVAYAVSFPFAMAMIFAYRSFGLGAVPYLAAMLLVCAHAVRMTIENRALRRQLWAVEALGRACESGIREEIPFERFLALAHELVAFERAVLWLAEEGSSELHPRVVWPPDAPPPDPAEAGPETLLERMCHRSTPLLVTDTRRDPRQPIGARVPNRATGSSGREGSRGRDRPSSWLLFPILLHGRSVGVAQFIRSARRPFTLQDKQRLASLIPQVAVTFESVRLRHLMHRYANMATTDSLTGLLNHRHAQEVLRVELRRAERYGRPLAVMMLDVDGFKQFNDTYGHPQGDLLLQSIARILRANVRRVDHIGRYGGEEFIVILPETSYPEACALAERIRKAVENTPFATGDGRAIRKTVSIGLAAYSHDTKTATELLQQADNALYRAKRAGKNRVLVA